GAPADLWAQHDLGQLWDLPQDPVEHLLLISPDGVGEGLCRLVADRARQTLDGDVGGDLQGLGRARVLDVLEDFLLSSRAADEVERRVSQGQCLPNDALDEANARLYRAAALSELV